MRTAIVAVIVNLIINIVCTINTAKTKSEILKPYYEAQYGSIRILSWVIAIISSLVTYWLVLGTTGFWNTLGWILIVADTIATIGFSVVLRLLNKEEG